MVWNGGVHILPMVTIPAGVVVLVAVAMTRRWRPILLGAFFLVFGLAYAAPKLYPAVLFVTGDRLLDTRAFPHPDYVPLKMLMAIYLGPGPLDARATFGVPWSSWKYGNYVGLFSAVMLLVGVAWALGYPRKTPDRWLGMSLATAAVVCFILSLGEVSAWAPASLLGHVPLASGFRIPARYTMPFLLFATLSLAWTLQGPAAKLLQQRRISVVLSAVFLLSLTHMATVNRAPFNQAFQLAPLEGSFEWLRRPTQFTVDATTSGSPGHDSPMLRALASDRLFLQCFEPLQLRRTAEPEYPAVFSDDDRSIRIVRFLPNRVEFEATSGDDATRVYLNTNWSPG